MVERLLADARVDPAARDNFALRVASEGGHLAVVERLLADARVDPAAGGNNLAICRATASGHLAVVDRLLADARVINCLRRTACEAASPPHPPADACVGLTAAKLTVRL